MNVNQALSFICTTHEKSFFPEKFRRYLNFRLMTAVVVVFMSINFALNILSACNKTSASTNVRKILDTTEIGISEIRRAEEQERGGAAAYLEV